LLSTVPSTPQKPVAFSWMVILVLPPELEDELDELELDELLLDELEELVELLDEELLLEEDDDELEDEVLELEELLPEPVPPSPTHAGAIKLPSWLPCTPKALVAVWPGAGNCQLQQWVN
jgi:hypothetical protein